MTADAQPITDAPRRQEPNPRLRFSIVMPTLNQGDWIGQSVRSVLDQRGPFDLELIVIDGGSRDGTLGLLESVGDPRLTWTSEPDRGQSHAINKGLARASGDVVAWLNSDDRYAPGALARVADLFASRPQVQWCYGRCRFIGPDGRPRHGAIMRYKELLGRRFRRWVLVAENFINQPSVFWRRDLGRRAGPLDESLRFCMDYDYWLRLSRLAEPASLAAVLSEFRLHGASISTTRYREMFDEDLSIARRWRDRNTRWAVRLHALNRIKIVTAYRLMSLLRLR